MPQGLKILGSIDKVGAENLRAGRDVRAGPEFGGEHAPPPTVLPMGFYADMS